MPAVSFSHSQVNGGSPLIINTGANQITWGYTLNTQSYPTYAGEVVQILSCNIDDLQITGDVRSYTEMEKIYSWFMEYLLSATQGAHGPSTGYKEEAVVMSYPSRGWKMGIQPKSLPSMKYGREIVVPSWTMIAAVKDPDPAQYRLTTDAGATAGDVANWQGRLDANIGLTDKNGNFRLDNPFSDPNAPITVEEHALYPQASNPVGTASSTTNGADQLTGLAAQMQAGLQSLVEGRLSDIFAGWTGVSQPTSSAGTPATGSSAGGTGGAISRTNGNVGF